MADQLLTFPINHNDPPDTDQIGMRFVTVSLGPLVFQVLFIVSQRRIALNVPVEYQAHVTPIWPRVAGVRPMVDWPQPFLDDTGLDIFANATLSPMVIHRGETRRAGSLA